MNVLVDGTKVYGPALTTYIQMGAPIPTPSVRTGLTHDIYLTVAGNRTPEIGAGEVRIEVFRKPMIIWLWIGGGLMAIGTILSAFPGNRRRRPTDPVSAPISGAAPPISNQLAGASDGTLAGEPDEVPVG